MTRPKIGMSTLYCLGEPFRKMTQHLCEAEVSHIELVDDGLHALNKQRTSLLKDIAKSRDLKYSVHAPFADMNIASPSKSILKATLARLEKSLTLSRDLDAYLWVFHSGLKTGISMFYPNMDWLQNLTSIQSLSKTARDCGVRIAIENLPVPYPFLVRSVEDFTRFYEEVDDDVDLVFDIGHANLNGQVEQFLTDLADRIVHVHAHDNDGHNDQHLGIGDGTVNWAKVADLFKEISYDKIVIVESMFHAEESLSKAKQLFT